LACKSLDVGLGIASSANPFPIGGGPETGEIHIEADRAILGHRSTSNTGQVTHSEALRAGVVAVILRDERLLVIRRSRFVVAPRAICFPGGGIEPEESQEQALVRELQEELATLVLPVRRLWQSRTRWGVELAWWRAELAPDAVPVPQPAEVESIHWYTPTELTGVADLLDSNRAFLAAVERGEVRLD
jgi:8-oxo-dGTP diphosphatase